MAQLIRCRCLRPVVLLGRIAGTSETLMLPQDLAAQLERSGHVEQVTERFDSVFDTSIVGENSTSGIAW